jgi:hypothetical protein
LLSDNLVDRGVIATASELLEARHYPGVVAMCTDALEDEPECLPLLLIRAHARVALRRDLDAQADLRDVIRLDPRCAVAYRLLGELAARRDENSAAAQFFREALRLDPDDREAEDWLIVVSQRQDQRREAAQRASSDRGDPSVRPVAGAAKLPAPAPAAGHFPSPASTSTAASSPAATSTAASSPVAPTSAASPRLARGTAPPEPEERPTRPFARTMPPSPAPVRDASGAPMHLAPHLEMRFDEPESFAQGTERQAGAWRTANGSPALRSDLPFGVLPSGVLPSGVEPVTSPTLRGAPPMQRPAREAPRLGARLGAPLGAPLGGRSTSREPIPELPGFDEYLVANGILSRERLRAAQAYQRSMKVQLSTAIITLGLATPQRIEWAVVAHHSQVAHTR